MATTNEFQSFSQTNFIYTRQKYTQRETTRPLQKTEYVLLPQEVQDLETSDPDKFQEALQSYNMTAQVISVSGKIDYRSGTELPSGGVTNDQSVGEYYDSGLVQFPAFKTVENDLWIAFLPTGTFWRWSGLEITDSLQGGKTTAIATATATTPYELVQTGPVEEEEEPTP